MNNNLAIRILSGEVLGTNEQTHEAIHMAIKALKAEPVKHGRWVFIGGYGYQYRCSKCFMCADHRTNYCSHCGAKMDEVKR